MAFSLATILIVAGGLGLASHLLLFIRGEWHLSAVRLFWFPAIGGVVATVLQASYLNIPLSNAASNTILVYTAFLVPLFTSIVVYRIFFHRLRQFPGPFGAKVSKLWHTYHCRTSQNHLFLDGLHKKYGPFIRTGPCEITIVHPDGLRALHGPQSQCRKAVFYDIMKPDIALNTTRDLQEHRIRRRIWDQAFSTSILQQYRNRVLCHARKFERKVASNEGREINATALFTLFSTGMMVDLAFGRETKDSEKWTSEEEQDWQVNIDHARHSMSVLGPFSSVPWLLQIGFSMPGLPLVQQWLRMKQWARNCISARLKIEFDKPNISHWLIETYFNHPRYKGSMDWLAADTFLVIIAGSDTVSASLNFVTYHLAQDERVVSRLREELDKLVSHDGLDFNSLQKQPYLNAVIEETLRLHPLIPTGLARETPPDGLTVGNTHIPGGVTVFAPAWCISRLDECFDLPTEFIPERWLPDSKVKCSPSASRPFNQSRYACPGKLLAMDELRIITALLVTRYDIQFAEDRDRQQIFNDMRDCFVANPGELRLIFKHR